MQPRLSELVGPSKSVQITKSSDNRGQLIYIGIRMELWPMFGSELESGSGSKLISSNFVRDFNDSILRLYLQ